MGKRKIAFPHKSIEETLQPTLNPAEKYTGIGFVCPHCQFLPFLYSSGLTWHCNMQDVLSKATAYTSVLLSSHFLKIISQQETIRQSQMVRYRFNHLSNFINWFVQVGSFERVLSSQMQPSVKIQYSFYLVRQAVSFKEPIVLNSPSLRTHHLLKMGIRKWWI